MMAAARAAVRAVRLAAGWEAAMAAASGFNTRKSRMKIPWRETKSLFEKREHVGILSAPNRQGSAQPNRTQRPRKKSS